MPAPSTDDLDLATHAAREAGELLRREFGRRLGVDYKSPDQPVTEADRGADRLLHSILREARPSYGWWAEESEAERLDPELPIWVVDPLDGTRNFVEERPEFAVCVGLLVRGTPQLGVVYNPMGQKMYSALRRGPAMCDGVEIAAAGSGERALKLAASWTELEDGRLDRLGGSWDIVTLGSTALKMTAVAEGSVDAYVSVGRKEIWDVCAGAAIAEAAGAVCLDLEGAPLQWGLGFEARDGLIVAGRSARSRIDEIRWALKQETSARKGEPC
jgi:myo-inositol-1(or 4)-monophosphatase